MSDQGSQPEIIASAPVVEQILDRPIPAALADQDADVAHQHLAGHRETARHAQVAQTSDPRSGRCSAAQRGHYAPLGLGAERATWQSGHFREAATAAAKKIRTETQSKVARRGAAPT